MTRPALAVAAALALTAATLGGQSARVELPIGARARLRVPARHGWVTGTIAAADSAVIVLRVPPAAAHDTFLVAWVQTLEVSRGQRRSAARAAAGLLIGAAVGGGLGAAMGSMNEGRQTDSPGFATAVFGVGGALLGGIVGAGVGGSTARERWEPVRLGPR